MRRAGKVVCMNFSRETHRTQEMSEEKGGVDEREAGVGEQGHRDPAVGVLLKK